MTSCPPLERLELGAGRFVLVAPAVAEEARYLAVLCLDRLLGELLGAGRGRRAGRGRWPREPRARQVVGDKLAGPHAAEELRGVGEGLVRVGARHERRDRRRLLLLTAAAAEPAQPPMQPPAVPGGAQEGAREEEGADCDWQGNSGRRREGVGGDESGHCADMEHANAAHGGRCARATAALARLHDGRRVQPPQGSVGAAAAVARHDTGKLKMSTRTGSSSSWVRAGRWVTVEPEREEEGEEHGADGADGARVGRQEGEAEQQPPGGPRRPST